MIDEVRHVLDTHPLAAGRDAGRDPLPGRRLLVRAAVTTARARLALTAGSRRRVGVARHRVAARARRCRGRVMLGIEPDLLARGRRPIGRVALVSATNGKTTTTRLLAEALGPNGIAVATNHTGANMPAGHRGRARARAATRDVAIIEVDERWLPKVVDPLGAELLVLGNLTRDQLDRFGEVRASPSSGARSCSTHPDLRSSPTPRTRTSCGRRSRPNPTWVALGAPWRSDAATCPRCAALLDWSADRFDCPVRVRPARDAAPARRRRARARRRAHPDAPRASPARWNRMNAALALAAAVAPLRGADRPRRGRARDASRSSPVGSPPGASPTVATRACCSPRTRPAGPRCCAGSQGPRRAGVVLAVNAHVADGRDPSWLWDVPYELLRGRPVAASGERALDVAVRLDYGGVDCVVEPDPLVAAARLPGDEVDIIASYTQFTASDPAVVVIARVDRPRRAGVPRAARDLRRPRQRRRARRALPPARDRRRAGRGRSRAPRSPTRSTSTCSAAARTTRR